MVSRDSWRQVSLFEFLRQAVDRVSLSCSLPLLEAFLTGQSPVEFRGCARGKRKTETRLLARLLACPVSLTWDTGIRNTSEKLALSSVPAFAYAALISLSLSLSLSLSIDRENFLLAPTENE